MANIQATLLWRCKTPNGWRRFQVLFGGNGRVRKGWVMEGNPPKETQYPEGSFQLRYYEGDKVAYKNIGPDTNKALDEKRVLEKELKARGAVAETNGTIQITEGPQRKTLAKAYAAFLQATEDRGSMEAKLVYRTAVDEFFQVVRKTYVDELNVEDMLKYQRHLRERGCEDRTIYNRWANVKAFFLYCGFDPKKMPREDGEVARLMAPKYEEQTPEVYEPREMEKFFKAVEGNDRFYTACQIMHKCGLREQEVVYLEWSNVNLRVGVLSVRANPRFGFKVKDKEQRDIPIPERLVEWLESYRKAHPDDRLVCPTRSGKPNNKLLRTLKRAVHNAGLNCAACEGCDHNNECSHWFLHKFRATAITMWLRSPAMGGADLGLRTVMELSGHSDLASVMRYLSPADRDSVRKGVSAIQWGD